MRRILAAVVLCAWCASPAFVLRTTARQAETALDFGRTMRIDYLHTGGAAAETVKLDAVVSEGPWPGSRTQTIDKTNLGKYFFEVADRASGRVLYSRGFASMYGEWETVPEFRTTTRTFHESLRFPWPARPVRIIVKRR